MVVIGASSLGDEALQLLQGVSAAALWECAGTVSGGLPRRRPLRASQRRAPALPAQPQRGAAPARLQWALQSRSPYTPCSTLGTPAQACVVGSTCFCFSGPGSARPGSLSHAEP